MTLIKMISLPRRTGAYVVTFLVILVFFVYIQLDTKVVLHKNDRVDQRISDLEVNLGQIEVKLSLMSDRIYSMDHMNSGGKAVVQGYINPLSFKYRINKPRGMCKNAKFSMFVCVHSAAVNFEGRHVLRQTWANGALLKRLNIGFVFITGIVTNDSTVMQRIAEESDRYGDIVQTEYVDVYTNISIKSTSSLNWAAIYCAPYVPVILKSDDDIFVNITRLMDYIKEDLPKIVSANGDKLVLCNLWSAEAVIRDPKDRWYIPEELYDKKVYPPFCQGSALIFTNKAVMSIKDALFGARLFPLDDVLLTGFIVPRAGVKHVEINERHLHSLKERNITNKDLNSNFMFVHTTLTNLLKLWDHMPVKT